MSPTKPSSAREGQACHSFSMLLRLNPGAQQSVLAAMSLNLLATVGACHVTVSSEVDHLLDPARGSFQHLQDTLTTERFFFSDH